MLRKLFSQTAVYGVSTVVSRFLNYLLTPFLTRVLTEDVYGISSLYYGIIPFANVVLTMGLTVGYFRFASKCKTEEEKRELFSTVWVAVSLLSILFFAVVASFSDTLSYTDVRWYAIVTAALIMVDNINALPIASLREQGRAKLYTIINITSVVVNVVVCWGIYTFLPGATEHAGWVMAANLVASSVSTILLLPSALKMFVWRFSLKVLKTISIYSIPLMIAGLMGTASDFIDRQMINSLLPTELAHSQVGIYGAVSKIAALMFIFRQIYTLGAEPFFLQNFKKEDFRRLNAQALKYYIVVGLAIFLGITLFETIFAKIIGPNFRSGMIVVPLLLMANLFAGIQVTLSFWYKQENKTSIAIYITLAGLIVTVVMNYFLIPLMGYEGAAWTRLTASFLMVVISYILGQIFFPIQYDMRRIALYFIVALGIYALSLQSASLSPIVQYSINFLLLLSYVYLAYKLEWKELKS